MTSFFFFFNDTATTEIYTLSLHDALPISVRHARSARLGRQRGGARPVPAVGVLHGLPVPLGGRGGGDRSEEHTSELQSRLHLVCRLLLEKKKRAVSRPAGKLERERAREVE